jgi:hypothetical protein
MEIINIKAIYHSKPETFLFFLSKIISRCENLHCA